jgi:hypothetical protein
MSEVNVRRLTLISSDRSKEEDKKFAAIAAFAGTPTRHVDITRQPSLERLYDQLRSSNEGVFAVSATTFAAAQALLGRDRDSWFAGLTAAFIYGVDDAVDEDLTSRITGGSLWSAPPYRGRLRYTFTRESDRASGPLAGMSFSVEGEHSRFRALRLQENYKAIITAGDCPYLIKAKNAGCSLFMTPSSRFTDLDAPAGEENLRTPDASGLLPSLIFLRAVFGETCWHNPHPRATLTIDDPLLKRRYGFLSYEELMNEVEAGGFATTLAFIPWNYRRSWQAVVDLLLRHPDRASICIHGCDHTQGEFESNNHDMLRYKARLALERMNEHRRLTRLQHEPIMIFPQGRFSVAALHALSVEGYLAAVNTSPIPSDQQNHNLKLRDLFNTSVSYCDGFPVFARRYPTSIESIALDLFLGKPAILVEHHTYFRDGYERPRDFLGHVGRLDRRLKWAPLESVLMSSGRYKRAGSMVEAQFFTRRFVIKNPFESTTSFVVSAKSDCAAVVSSVLRNGYPIDARRVDDAVEAEVELAPHEEAVVEVPPAAWSESPPSKLGATYAASVALRRYLSEFRDNHLSRSDGLLNLSRRIMHSL